MTEKNTDLPQTHAALAGLSSALQNLSLVLESKKTELAQREKKNGEALKDKEARLNILKESSQKIIHNIDAVMSRLDKVLENDGASNHNNQ